jgi:hypothetical protein
VVRHPSPAFDAPERAMSRERLTVRRWLQEFETGMVGWTNSRV